MEARCRLMPEQLDTGATLVTSVARSPYPGRTAAGRIYTRVESVCN